MIVDTHTHVWHSPEQWGPQIGALLRRRYAPADHLDGSCIAHSEAMAGVDAAFVLGFRSRLLGAELPVSLVHSTLAAAPEKLIGFAGIDPMDDRASEALDTLAEHRMQGIVISPSEQGFHPSHSQAMKLYEKCEAMGLPIVVHQGEEYVRDSVLEFAQPMLLDTVARDFPRLKIMLTHCGHPFTEQSLTLIGKHPGVYTEIGGLTSRPRQLYQVLLLAHQMDVTDKILFGSDFPRQTPSRAMAAVYSLSQLSQGTMTPTVPREKLRGIIQRDALEALGLKRPAPGPAEPEGKLPIESVETI